LVDSLNQLGVSGIPLTFAIDEYGVIRRAKLRLSEADRIEQDFLSKTFEPPAGMQRPTSPPRAPDLAALERAAAAGGPAAWQRYGNALFVWGGPQRLDDAIAAYQKVLEVDPEDGAAQFRLGVAYRARYDSSLRHPDDFQAAVSHWARALDIDPNQYIWRRRIQQYGPRLAKPYPFYDWVETARSEIRARGETPVELPVEPRGAEIAQPSKDFETSRQPERNPDPKGRILRDDQNLIELESAVVPPAAEPGGALRVHLVFSPNQGRRAHWNNEADPLEVWMNAPPGWTLSRKLLSTPNPPRPVSVEEREVELEVRAPDQAAPGTETIQGYALYYVCEDVDGACLYRRQDIEIPVRVRAASD